MRYNPCGYIVDWARVPYKTQCRFLRDDDRVNTVRWAEANADALTLPFESVICNAYNEIDHYLDAPVGEVYGARRPYTGQRAPQGLFSGHYCGTEDDFAQGGLYEPEKPPVKYGSLGWPLCCDPPLRVGGGAGASGRATYAVYPPLARLSGAGAGGQADYIPTVWVDPAEGGVEVGGAAGDVFARIDPAEGGVEVGGEAGDVFAWIDPAEGGVEVGGEAGDVFDPGTPVPGTTCAAAPILTLGVTYNFTTAAGAGTQQWVRWVGTGPVVTFGPTPTSFPTLNVTAFTGSDCSTLTNTQTVLSDPFFYGPTSSGNVWLRVANDIPGAHAWSVRLT